MKSQFAHYKNRATGFGVRGLAVMLCFVMLLTAIGAGTMMTAFSAKADLTGSTAIADTAQKVVDIAATVNTEAEDTEEDQSILPDLSKKIADLADTGANVDLAGTKEEIKNTNYAYVYGNFNSAGDYSSSWNSFSMTSTASSYDKYEFTIYLKANYDFEFKIIAGKRENNATTWEHKYGLNSSTGFIFTSSATHYHNLLQRDGSGYNLGLKTTTANSGYVKIKFTFQGQGYNSGGNNSHLIVDQTAVNSSLSASKSDITGKYGGDSVSLTPTVTGGSSSYNYSYSVVDSVGNNVSGNVSGTNFTVPYITENEVYTVTATVTDSNIPSLSTNCSYTISASPKVSDYYVLGASTLTRGKNWNESGWENDSSLKMIQTDSEWYQVTFNNAQAGEFKIVYHSGNTTTWYSGSNMNGTDSMTTSGNLTSTLSGTDNISLSFEGSANVTIKYKNGTGWVVQAVVNNSTQYSVTVNDTDTEHRSAIATASPASTYQGSRVTIATSPNSGYKAVLAVSGGITPTKSGNNFYFNMPASNVTVDVTYELVQAVPVTVYSNPGGEVQVAYGTAISTISSGKNTTIMVNEGDSITLSAIASGNNTFKKWYRNLNDNYSTEATITETINSGLTYVAAFDVSSGGGDDGDWIYTADNTTATPEKTGSTNAKFLIYDDDDNLSDGPSYSSTVYQDGNYYWCDLTNLLNGNDFWFGLNNNNSSYSLCDSTVNPYINGTQYGGNGGPNTFTDSDGNELFKADVKEYSGNKYIRLSGFQTSNYSAIGVLMKFENNGGGVRYQFYYKQSGGGSVDADEFIPTVNYYFKETSSYNRDGYDEAHHYQNTYLGDVTATVVEIEDQVNIDGTNTNTKYISGLAVKGSTITVSTTLPTNNSLKATDSTGNEVTVSTAQKYYVVGYSFNGVTPEILEPNDTSQEGYNTYTCSYKIPANTTSTILEITPIFFIRPEYDSNTAIFLINGYDKTIQSAGWGNTLYVYPFYKRYKNNNNDQSGGDTTYYGQAENFGGYAGMPVVNNGGQLYTQVPLTNDGTTTGTDVIGNPIKGVTINNGYFDHIHRDGAKEVTIHRQTYDYDDFAKIYNEKKMKDGNKFLHSIYFSFKYHEEDTSYQHRYYSTTSTRTSQNSRDRYNDEFARHTATVSESTLDTFINASTGWEYLTDSLGNNVDLFGDKITKPSAKPLKVVSMGYEFNNSGEYATEWAVYAYDSTSSNYKLVYSGNSADGTNSSIVPSALVMNSADSFANYAAMDGDQQISGYEDLYTALKDYSGIPVQISYEHEGWIAYNDPKAYRSDGRWTYTTVNDYVKSNIIIEYDDKDGNQHRYKDSTYEPDTFVNTHVGENTGCSAYFTNSDFSGEVESTSELISNTEKLTFKAEAAGSYEFVGWYMYDIHDKESLVTESTDAETLRSGNFVLAARFKYVADGNLTITNKLAPGNNGRGVTYLGVTLINGSQQIPRANINTNTESVTIDKSYINSNSNYTIKVEIKTVPLAENRFDSYSCNTTDNNDAIATATDTDIYNSTKSENSTDVYEISVKRDLYNNSTTQIVKAIDYISTLDPVTYAYSIKYNYTSRQYGDQAFTKEGTLTSGQINDTKVVTGTSGQADKKLTKEFLAKIAPHESNFNEKITWDFDSVVDSQTCNYNNGTNTYTISLTIDGSKQKTDSGSTEFTKQRHGYFTVPYELSAVSGDNGIPLATEGKVNKAAKDKTFTVDADYDEFFKDSQGNFVTAPSVIYDGETARYFKYWEYSIVSGSRGDSRVVGKCYYHEFNYRAFNNYNITAVYSTDEDSDMTETSYADLYKDGQFTTIDFIGNTRNQWNNNDNGDHTYYAGDLVYNDFILSFKPEGQELFKDLDQNVECGFVIQRLKEIETNASGTNAKTLQEYAKDYSDTDLDNAKAAAKTKAGNGTATGYTQIKVSINQSQINDKNRCHYAYAMWNTNQRTNGGAVYPATNAYSNTKYLYRAYSYMKIGNGDYIMSEKPAYFYMYDIAQQ